MEKYSLSKNPPILNLRVGGFCRCGAQLAGMSGAQELFEEVIKIAGDALVEVEHVATRHVVALTRIDKIVGLRACIFGSAEEHERMLQNAGGIVVAYDDLQTTFQVFGAIDEVRSCVAFGVGLWRFHIAFAIHHFVVFPVEDGTTGYTDFENVGVGEHEVGGHESTEAPTVDTQTIGIDIGQRSEFFHTLHLVFHLNLAEMAVSAALEVETTITRTAVVEDEEDIAAIRHVVFPRAGLIVERLLDVGGMRTAINIDHSRIFLCGVEVYGFHQTIVEWGLPIGSEDRAIFHFRHGEVAPWIFGIEEAGEGLFLLGALDVDVAVVSRCAPSVAEIATVFRKASAVQTYAIVQQSAATALEIDSVEVFADVSALIGANDDAALCGVESEEVEHFKLALRELAEHLAVGVEEVEVVEAIALALVDELVLIPREEGERILRFYEAFVSLGVERLEAFTSVGVISHEVATLLAAWYLHDVEGFAIRTPRDVGEIAVGDIA